MHQLFPNSTSSSYHLFKQNFTADSHPLEETLFQDIFDFQSLKCEITYPLGFVSSCASSSPLHLSLFTNKSVCIACLSHRNVAKLGVCKAVWLKGLFPIKPGSKHLKKLDNIQIPDGHQWLLSIKVIDSRNWGRIFIRAETFFFFLVCLKFGY